MNILIRGMEMPTKENFVILINPQGGVWMIGDIPNEDTYLVKANAVPVPPHGRLIDADALEKVMSEGIAPSAKGGGFKHPFDIIRAVANAPTIIPAEEGTQKDGGQDE